MKNTILQLLFVCLFSLSFGQKILPLDSAKTVGTTRFFVDDYRSIYLYKNRDFSLTKFDSLGKQMGKIQLTLPYKIQSVQNPLNVVLFSENSQEIKFLDQNLNETSHINLREKFGFVRSAFVEDLQTIWLLDESTKTLNLYSSLDDRILKSTPYNFDTEGIVDFLVYKNQTFILKKHELQVYGGSPSNYKVPFKSECLRLQREGDIFYILTEDSIQKSVAEGTFAEDFTIPENSLGGKNSEHYYLLKDGKVLEF